MGNIKSIKTANECDSPVNDPCLYKDNKSKLTLS